MERRSFLTALAGLATTALVPVSAEAATWNYLGRRSIHLLPDYDEIYVGPGRGLFRKLRFKFTGNAVIIHKIRVEYMNGTHQDLAVRWVIPQGGVTRVIDLRGAQRYIRKIRFWYQHPLNFRGKAYVWAWGRR